MSTPDGATPTPFERRPVEILRDWRSPRVSGADLPCQSLVTAGKAGTSRDSRAAAKQREQAKHPRRVKHPLEFYWLFPYHLIPC
ncbi:hypothetical protein BaRGS_00019660 [Batillaria attramentaria]|uniref:Uncharacterized protein n=1 Tax=Batillaria attramentaria TaxID=370345 RepID=A0ABD0KPI9_9CAEN